MKSFAPITLTALAAPLSAAAHPGHLAGLAGHDHWIAGAAIGAAIALGAWSAVKGWREAQAKADDGDDTESGETPAPQES